MKSTKLRLAVGGLAILGIAACESGLTDINRNPNAPEVVPIQNVLANGIIRAVGGGGVGSHGEWMMLYHTSLWPQHVAQPVYNTEDRYEPRASVIPAIWENIYASALQDLADVKANAQAAGQTNMWTIAEIMTVYTFLLATDLFGDVPYSEALRLEEGIRFPAYDPQPAIFESLIQRLETAVGQITAEPLSGPLATGDLIYGGDMDAWRRFGNSLRLRIAMRMSGSADRPTDRASQAAQAFAAAWNSQVFSSVADNAELVWPGSLPAVNPINNQIIVGQRTGDFRLSEALTTGMLQFEDPRLSIYADPAASDGSYRGLRNGTTPVNHMIGGREGTVADFASIGSYFLRPDLESVLMSYAEVLFLGAEAAARGWIPADAATLYRQAITASMQQYNIPQQQIDAYLARPAVQYDGLQSIGVQKWIALFLAGPEAYNEFRRTGIPNLQPSVGSSLPAGRFPARIPYPTSEALRNPEHFPRGVQLDDPVWFARVNR
jgi:hypothetical protein